jgi:hypothetical protein
VHVGELTTVAGTAETMGAVDEKVVLMVVKMPNVLYSRAFGDVDVDIDIDVAVKERVTEPQKATLELMAVGTASRRVVELTMGADYVSETQNGPEVAVEAAVDAVVVRDMEVSMRGMNANGVIEKHVGQGPVEV